MTKFLWYFFSTETYVSNSILFSYCYAYAYLTWYTIPQRCLILLHVLVYCWGYQCHWENLLIASVPVVIHFSSYVNNLQHNSWRRTSRTRALFWLYHNAVFWSCPALYSVVLWVLVHCMSLLSYSLFDLRFCKDFFCIPPITVHPFVLFLHEKVQVVCFNQI